MTSFECQVCFEQRTDRLPLMPLSTVNGDVLRSHDCGHPVCRSCLASFVKAQVEELRPFGIRCPIEGCKNQLYEQDVEKLVKDNVLKLEVATQLATLRKQNYTSRMSDVFDDLGCDRSLRLCPRCNVIIQRRSGCNNFGCICGHKFNFAAALCLSDFMVAKDVASKHNLSQSDALDHVIAAVTSKGIKNYRRVLGLAECRNISLELAEVHMQSLLGQSDARDQLRNARFARRDLRKQKILVKNLCISSDEAKAILRRAKDGDVSAWSKIQEARQLGKAASRDVHVER